MKKSLDYDAMALDVMLSSKPFDPSKHGAVYRKDKGWADVQKAVQKAIKNGMHRTEFELSMLALYLKGVFKPERP